MEKGAHLEPGEAVSAEQAQLGVRQGGLRLLLARLQPPRLPPPDLLRLLLSHDCHHPAHRRVLQGSSTQLIK